MLITGSDFCGIGAFDEALKQAGIKQNKLFACDWDKFARKSYIENHGEPKYFPKDVYEREIPNVKSMISCALKHKKIPNKYRIMKTEFLDKRLERLEQLNLLRELDFEEERELAEIKRIKQLIIGSVSSSLPNVYEEPHNSARIKFYKNLAETMNVSEYATRHIFNEACDWYKTLT